MEMGRGGFGQRGREERGRAEQERDGMEANGGRREEIRNALGKEGTAPTTGGRWPQRFWTWQRR